MAQNKSEMAEYTMKDVQSHNTREDAWIVVNDRVFDVVNDSVFLSR